MFTLNSLLVEFWMVRILSLAVKFPAMISKLILTENNVQFTYEVDKENKKLCSFMFWLLYMVLFSPVLYSVTLYCLHTSPCYM